jgi:acetyl esterase/lipase
MRKKYLVFFGVMIIIFCGCSDSDDNSSDDLGEEVGSLYEPTDIVTFKTIDGIELNAHIFNPVDLDTGDERSVLVYFHGGGWTENDASEGYELCDYFASFGMVAISFDYRLAGEGSITPVECIIDAKSAVRWTRDNADELHINPDQIVASGVSAGGHLAACTGILSGFNEANEDTNISAVPDAMVLFSAVVNAADNFGFVILLPDGTDPENYSPYHHIRGGLPPTILFHGTSDTIIAPYSEVQAFTEEMVNMGNQCALYSFDGGHAFHLENEADYDEALDIMHDFFVSLGYIGADNEGE